ncbi:MAG TPA: FtsQ-type POTRA domain-containing protein [Candidatus Magasanikbacteria bacterium]|nr:FtsQ-type POTRA domain-containing protein [Candidatus Magasanikbacteria bacterium]
MRPQQRNSFWNNKRKYKKRDFLVKKFKNPYFLKERMPKRTKAPRLKIGLGIISLLGIIGVFLFHPYFLIKNIEVKGNQTVATNDILNRVNQITSLKRLFLFSGNNIFTVNTKKIKNELENNFIFKKLEITKDFPQRLIINIQEREAKMILMTVAGSSTTTFNYYVLDENGKNIRQEKEPTAEILTRLPNITIEKSSWEPQLSEQVISPANYEFINFLDEKLDNKNEIIVDKFSLATSTDKIVNVWTGEGWKIMFDRQSDWKKQLQVLETILKEKIKDRTNLKYIDVRFENRSYFQ